MHLLNVTTLRLETFMGAEESIPPYAILSHTWGEKEVLYNDIGNQSLNQLRELPAFEKVSQSCIQAHQDGFAYIWIDTCCIDQRSSAELSEAINSMFKWYQQSAVCYVFLQDFQASGTNPSPPQPHHQISIATDDERFCSSRWFTRGWTLQELIAPRKLLFFDQNWAEFGDRDGELFHRICRRTGILPQIFSRRHCGCSTRVFHSMRNARCLVCGRGDNLPDLLGSLSASIIMSWAATRTTTRKEDISYSLMGLFSVNMPLLYGEGDKAFLRLQSAIVRQSNDHSILLWRSKDLGRLRFGCLARSPEGFLFPPPIVPQRVYYDFDNETIPRLAIGLTQDAEPMEVSDTVLRTTLWMCPCRIGYPYNVETELMLGILNCGSAGDYFVRPAILLSHMGSNLYRRIASDAIFMIDPRPHLQEPAAVTLSVYNKKADEADFESSWTTVSSISLGAAQRTDIRLMMSPSGPGVLRPKSLASDLFFSSSDAVCSIVNQLQDSPVRIRILGGFPTIYSAETCPPTLPMVRSLLSYDSWPTLTLVGGVHIFRFNTIIDPSEIDLCVIWGFLLTTNEEKLIRENWRPWCRIFDAKSLSGHTGMPLQDHKDEIIDPVAFQKRISAWLQRKSKDINWRTLDSNGDLNNVLPDTGHSKRAADRLVNLFPNSNIHVGLSARMSVVEGLGRKSNDVELTVLSPECRGWAGQTFDGSKADQEKVITYSGDSCDTLEKRMSRMRFS